LRGATNVLLTPHAAWYSEEAVLELRHKSVAAAITLLRGGRPAGLVTA
jgi:lactate dehydrogenase-like 2-hydroxyacid dehydrogenase